MMTEEYIQAQNMNDFFRALKTYCKGYSKEKEVWARRLLDIDKKDIIIFEADYEKVDFNIIDERKNRKLLMPTDRVFIEIPVWRKETKDMLYINLGGIFIFNEKQGDRQLITIYTFWTYFDKKNGYNGMKPMSMSYVDSIPVKSDINYSKGDVLKVGTSWRRQETWISDIDDEMKKEVSELSSKLLHYLLIKIDRKEYTSYKKWTPRGFETKEIVYSHEVSKHKRHFWKDSGRFKIPLMKKEEWEKEGYGTDEVVFRGGEVRRDVPFKIIGNYLVGDDKEIKEDNRRIKIAKGRIWRCEEKIYRILRELLPDKIIRRHDRRTLGGLELDFNLPEFRLGIEYDGEQHFDRKICEEVFKSDFNALVWRDREKEKRCIKKRITLIRIKYDEPLTKTSIKRKLKEKGIL